MEACGAGVSAVKRGMEDGPEVESEKGCSGSTSTASVPVGSDRVEGVDGETGVARRQIPRFDGVYLDGTVQGKEILCTIDTGATSSILSWNFFQSLDASTRPNLEAVKSRRPIGMADGTSMKVKGKAMFSLGLGPLLLKVNLTVGEIEDELLMGADLLQKGEGGPVNLLLVVRHSLMCSWITPVTESAANS